MRIEDLLADSHRENISRLKRGHRPQVASVLEENICKIFELRKQAEVDRARPDKVADAITAFSGGMPFLYLHLAWFIVWIIVNLHWTPWKPFDPYPFGLLTMIVSLEAIFLSTFVLISQNRMSAQADQRADLDLQINMLSEYEITRILRLVAAMAEKMGIEAANDPEIKELEESVAPDVVIDEIQRRSDEAKEL